MENKTIETKITVCRFEELSSEYQLIINKAKEQVEKSYAPYSNFHVGAALQLGNGEIVTGNNQENAAYPSGLCAERVAMFYANSQYPDVPVKTMAVAAYTKGEFLEEPISPCGACRQALLETEIRFEHDITILLYGTKHVYMIENVKELLPLSFIKESLKG
ncbi:cytidine deaminase [Paludibacter sp. 221]|uniref:cytidine deaminase n=1 Tax=Paludibacter sp. 221 TaxID=2302939 RepID=UPI0013D3E463|nr:cytidine deaminase [Paludibacter sp. 221]NDV45786.1 cytidine deaminase [Paludibacter sp. 221]